MKIFITFLRKEIIEQTRTKRLTILGLVFIFFGILNPLTAKLTPMILQMLSESMDNSGITITNMEITALDSWMQYFKNIPMLLIVFILMQSNIFSKEYQNQTLILVVTKGFERYKIVLSKLLVMILIWTLGYLLYFILTYVYTIYYWDNSIVSNLPFSVIIWWVFGIFIIALFMMFSVNFETSGSALALTGGVVFLLYLISLLPKINQYLPITLSDGNSLIYGLKQVGFYLPSLIITILLIGSLVMGSILLFNKKSL